MIPGYNHNVKYKERIFHVQTEDSGVKNPHIITLLYYGGNILSSVKSTYGELISDPTLDAQLPALMQKQHKEVLRGLVTGKYDDKISERSQGAAFLNGPAPLNVAEGSQHQVSFSSGSSGNAGSDDAHPPAPPPIDIAATMIPNGPQAAPEAPPGDGAVSTDGSFSTEGSLLDAMAKAVKTFDADSLKAALERGDDSALFETQNQALGDMMADFLKGS